MTVNAWLFLELVVLNIADIVTTIEAISRGGRELNPFMRRLMGRLGTGGALGLVKFIALALIMLLVLFVPAPYDVYVTVLLLVLCGYYAIILVNNFSVIRRLG
ncbi:MAG: hypothetical protein JRF46_01115 [Deltaproteobacteria bacterium]|nr:hypothetical protein [Deltaproteobacteria bacterium]MBW2298869.1 hypothetical protein [Deltaproteobacteria bacterium]